MTCAASASAEIFCSKAETASSWLMEKVKEKEKNIFLRHENVSIKRAFTVKYFYFTTLIVTRDDVNEYMKYHAEYTKANRFKDIVCKIYI